MIKRFVSMLLLLALVVTSVSAAYAQSRDNLSATVELKNTTGQSVGEITLTQEGNGVRLSGTFSNLPAGPHGIHVHTVGACSPDFSAAGGHFNPLNKQHGLDNPAGAHAGDMPNLQINADGTSSFNHLNTMITLRQGQPGSVYDADGSAIVIHAGADDQRTDPAGNSGDRIACGVIPAAAGLPDTGITSPILMLLAIAMGTIMAGLLIVSGTGRVRRWYFAKRTAA